MQICPSCGASNRDSARFCYQCAASLETVNSSSDDQAWLAETLNVETAIASSSEVVSLSGPLSNQNNIVQDNCESRGSMMDEERDVSPSEATLFANRYELVSQQEERVEVVDRRPWERCWACDATSLGEGEMFCSECGASLEGRHYRGQLLTQDALSGLSLVPEIADAQARNILPPIWDQVRTDAGLLTLVTDTGRTSVVPPLEELDAFKIGLHMARLLQLLHDEGFVLGSVDVSDLELTAAQQPLLQATPHLRRIDDAKEDTLADLQALTVLLEALTATPRTTQRLAEEEVVAVAESDLVELLRTLRMGEIVTPTALAERLDVLIAERTSPIPLWMHIGVASHPGMVRELDEDSLLALDLRMVQNSRGRSWGLFIVADGMGGHAAGEVASGLAIRGAAEMVLRTYLAPTLETDADFDEARLKDIVHKAIEQANEYVLREAHARGNDMGTTITMALVVGDRAIIGNVGDCRTYLYRDKQLRRITNDHSLVMRLVELGQITENDIYTHPQKNAVLRSLGDKSEVQIDIFSERLQSDDALFFCCDGQWEMVRDPQMAEIIDQHTDPQMACEQLIDAANAAGGEDNITSVIVHFKKFSE
ncbi:MAG: Stp1/IreP family PP2C-type Ser/Thr phosphatase [Chloroflexi bacterium AL-N1]|nr:Stp1/IreP family PP2C-type Ser/Thr phosphatase [Chloroflexi bacterium AL-N1]NOK92216.1 Stp1/IreP family PP2C-type Ser/Thr phosphatase [Chloroflexi bacterium AL-N15]